MFQNSYTTTSLNPFKDILNEISLFEQTLHCENYIRNVYKSSDESKILDNSKIASACFRQAKEYFIAGQTSSISTRPLMFSYSLNNYAKGFSYLVTEDASIHKGFNSHGFKSNTDNNIEKSSVKIRKNGVIDSLVKLVQHDKLVHSTKLSFEDLITLIPGIGDTLYASWCYVKKTEKLNLEFLGFLS